MTSLELPTVGHWSGREVRALRTAQRLSVRDFATVVGVSPRAVSRWESGGDLLHPAPGNQASLDAVLAQAGAVVQARFAQLVGVLTVEAPDDTLPARIVGEIDGRPMVLVPAGVFLCGPGKEPVRLAAFYIDVHPVTVGDFARFVRQTGHRPPGAAPQPYLEPPSDDHPVTRVSWQDAVDYASWAGKRLPTVREWEKAARGPGGNRYPWGDREINRGANTWESFAGGTTPVTAHPEGASPYGVLDLVGNVWEWTATVTPDGDHLCRGGSFEMSSLRATTMAQFAAGADDRQYDLGFRCAFTSRSG
ncbi:SUMF1/EgtB/PvdO family nonheme iron enzyme [Luedemannella helvata]|uniref:HTH cro/C1-type domain-containing protein n=1 Tax=Luedemannella helvata TaxID=349315 RepID=A0ABN2L1P0_9ACTN